MSADKNYHKEYYLKHKEEIKQRVREYYKTNQEEMKECRRKYHSNNKQKENTRSKEYNKKWFNTISGRVSRQICNYRNSDKKMNRGECNLTKDFMINTLFPKGCCYCGEKDFMKLGADRIDNTKPHTQDNVVCSCKKCNDKRQKKDFVEYFYERYIESIQI